MFALSEEQTLIRESAARFLEEAVPFAQRQATCETDDGYDPDLWQAYAEMGWLGIMVPEEDGGLGGSIVDAALIQQQMGKQLVRSPWLQHSVTAATGLALGGTDQLGIHQVIQGLLRQVRRTSSGNPYQRCLDIQVIAAEHAIHDLAGQCQCAEIGLSLFFHW